MSKRKTVRLNEIYQKDQLNEGNDILFVSPYLRVNGKHWNLLGNKCVEKLVAKINRSGLHLIK